MILRVRDHVLSQWLDKYQEPAKGFALSPSIL